MEVRAHEGPNRGRSSQGVVSRRCARRSHRRAPRACRLLSGPLRLEVPRTLGEAVPRAPLGRRERRRARSAPGGEVGCSRRVGGGRSTQAFGTGAGPLERQRRKNDGIDALATALAASRNGRLAAVDPEAASEVLRLLSERREDLVAERTRALNRLHGLLRDLLPGGVTGKLSADRAARIYAAYGPGAAPRPACAGGWRLRYCATSALLTGRSRT
jgi:hypothetical protein